MKKTLAVISHTHWDREWYQPFEVFRMRLCDLMDNLLIIMKNQPNYRFHLDAQIIVLEDYLELRPDKRPLLKKYIKEGRILIGPWYVQNDFNLTSGEATVRNLMIGQSIADEYGACMRIGYMADQFGLASQLPQLYRDIGIDFCIFGRGANAPDTPPQFIWEGADGSAVTCEFMKWWYNNLQRLPSSLESALKLTLSKVNAMSPYMKTDNYLLMNGVDHLEAQEDLLPIITELQKMLPEDYEIYQDTLPEFAARTLAEIKEKGTELPHLKGELRLGGENVVLTGTLSSRVYLKQANFHAQNMLEKRLEPLYTILDGRGIIDYPKDHLKYLWKLLIQNHPHDSICGCSVDPVHRHMVDRFERISENTSELLRRGMQALSDAVDRKSLKESDYLLTVLNTVPYNGSEMQLEAEVMTVRADNVKNFELIRSNGKKLPFILKDIIHKVYSSISPINLPGNVEAVCYRIRFMLPIASIGYETLTVRPCDGELKLETAQNARANYMENEYLRCEINENGTLTLTDKETGKLFHGLMYLEDSEEIGDDYQHRESIDSVTYTSLGCKATIEAIEDNELMQSRRISYVLTVDRDGEKDIAVSATVSLAKNSRFIRVNMTFENTARYHRLRVLFPTYIKTDKAYAGAPFDCVCRPLADEDNDRRQPNTGFVAFTDGKNGIAILNEGLYEYEHKKDKTSTVALTLVRSTGFIFGTRENHSEAPEWLSEEAQCLGTCAADFAIMPFVGELKSGGVFAEAEMFGTPPVIYSAPVDMRKLLGGRPFVQDAEIGGCIFFRNSCENGKKLPLSLQSIKVTGDNGAIRISAYKKAENGCARIVRLFNTTEEEIGCTLAIDKRLRSIARISADERLRHIESLPFEGRKLSISLKAKEIVTLEIK